MLKKCRSILALLVSAALLMSHALAVTDLPLSQQVGGLSGLQFDETEYISYEEYQASNPEAYAKEERRVEVPVTATEEKEGKTAFHWTENTPEIGFTVNVPETGLYTLWLTYYMEGENAYTAKRNLLVNGEVPFDEAIGVAFNRRYEETGKGRQNELGDQLRGQIVPVKEWYTEALIDSTGICGSPFALYLESGENTITLQYDEKDMYVHSLIAQSAKPLPAYEEVSARYKQEGYKPAAIEGQKDFQAEDIVKSANDVTIRREYSTDITVTPYTVKTKSLNIYGGGRWKTGGQSVDFTLAVPATGLYQLAFHSAQNMGDGLPIYRQIAIDGQVPFTELLAYEFQYTSNYQTHVVGKDENNPYLFYLTEGTHTLTMTAKRGDMQFVLQSLESDMLLLSQIQLDITKITGNEPDPNYDYEFFAKLPGLKGQLQALSASLQQKIDYIGTLTGRTPSVASSLKSIKVQIDDMVKDPFSIARNASDLGNSQTKLGTWYLSLLNSSMSLDKISLAPSDRAFKTIKRSVWKLIWANIETLFLSFARNYTSIPGYLEEGVEVRETINVWVARGTSWAELIKELSDTHFTPESGVMVNINTVPASQLNSGSANVLMLSIVSGRQPDVAMAVMQNSPVEFAIREAVTDLTGFSDYDEVSTRFYPEIQVPYTYKQGVYALPETMDFKALFYRKDVISRLGIAIPNNRAELYSQTLPALYNQGLTFCYPRDDSEFILQYGGQYYTDDGLASALDTPEVYQAMKEETELYTQYSIPVSANFYNRFRTGEMPMGIASYAMYLQLLSAAPEIAGRWGIAPVPGLAKSDGTVDRSAAAFNSVGDIILAKSEKQDASWAFLKWWTDYETQVEFARELEALLGAEARWNTANVQAFEALPWKSEDSRVIDEMLKADREIPVVLGGYYSARHLTNAWNSVVLNGASLRDELEKAVEAVNKELKMKQEEYGVSQKK